jgi:hypothetical protein
VLLPHGGHTVQNLPHPAMTRSDARALTKKPTSCATTTTHVPATIAGQAASVVLVAVDLSGSVRLFREEVECFLGTVRAL